jgi:hypothetical protein
MSRSVKPPSQTPSRGAELPNELNAMMSHANKGSLYAEDWAGTPAQNFTVLGMSAAIAALAASLGPESVPANTSEGLNSKGLTSKVLPRAAIIGIAVGSSILGLLILLAYYLWRRGRTRKLTGVGAFIHLNKETSSAEVLMSEPRSVSLPDSAYRTDTHDPVQRPFSQPPEDQTYILPITNKKTALFWKNQLPASFADSTNDPLGPPLRSVADSSPSLQQSAPSGSITISLLRPEIVSTPNFEAIQVPPSVAISSSAVSPDIRQLLQRAESLQSTPGSVPRAQAVELQQRLEELGPIPEVLEALQAILRRQNAGESGLPRYEERHAHASF